jgi:vacuolar-type H+-ATPase subunit F/Vma7
VGRLVVLGEAARVDGFALGGAVVIHADEPDDVRRCWNALPDDTAVVVLTCQAAAALEDEATEHEGVFCVVMPP